MENKEAGGVLASWRDFRYILQACGILTPKVWACLLAYYVLTPIGAILDGASWLLLLQIFAGASDSGTQGVLTRLLPGSSLSRSSTTLLAGVAILFFLKALIAFILAALSTALSAVSRRRIQQTCFTRLMRARWADLRSQSVGRWMGVIMEETPYFVKIIASALQAAYSLITGAILLALAIAMDARLSVFLGVVAVPVWLGLRLIYRRQGLLSNEQARARQGFAADLNERLIGLYQIKAADETPAQETLGLRHQPRLQALEIGVGRYIGMLNAFNPLLFGLTLGAFVLLSIWQGGISESGLLSFGSVGILAARAAGQLSIIAASFGDFSRLAGSIAPLKTVLALASENVLEAVPEPVSGVRLVRVSYSVGSRVILRDVSLEIEAGRVFLLTGASGAGKTSLANLIAGLDSPSSGEVLYRGASGKSYPSVAYKARIGYVPQDVHLYSGTVRENLDPWGKLSDDDLLESLSAAGAGEFVASMGGLDAYLVEAGRSVSGGERRRIGIAKALAQKADCLILDEITNGLDEETKSGLLQTVERLAKTHLLIVISHDLDAFESAEKTLYRLMPAAAA